jgi:hypothetical protein
MVVTCWSVKGGSGTTVVAAAVAVAAYRVTDGGVLLVDLAGDAVAALGLADEPGDGLQAWLGRRGDAGGPGDAGDRDDAGELGRLERRVDDRLSVLPWRSGPKLSPDAVTRVPDLLARLVADGRFVVIDAGTVDPTGEADPAGHLRRRAIASAERSVLVVRCCYLALRRAASEAVRPDAVVVVTEPGRSLTPRDVESVAGAPVVAQVALDPQVARVVDAGLLPKRLGRAVERSLRDLVQA